MVRVKGLEPPCRKTLDPKSSASANFATLATKNGVPGGIRTPDTRLRRAMLYPAELLRQFVLFREQINYISNFKIIQ